MLSVEGICKKFGNKQVLNNLTFKIAKGEIYGFVGPNGAGKTTTMKILSGLLKADSGVISYENKNLLEDITLLKEKIGYMPDFFGVYDNLMVMEYLEFYGSANKMSDKDIHERSLKLLEMMNLSCEIDSYVDDLSRGMKQRLCLVRTLLHDPEIIILDEPTSGLDVKSKNDLQNMLKMVSEQGKTVIISSHILSELAQICTSVGIIESGSMIMSGKLDDVLDKVDEANPLIISVLNNVSKAIEVLKENPLVKTITLDENNISITFAGKKGDEAILLRELVINNINVSEFKREQSNLESIFLKITGENK